MSCSEYFESNTYDISFKSNFSLLGPVTTIISLRLFFLNSEICLSRIVFPLIFNNDLGIFFANSPILFPVPAPIIITFILTIKRPHKSFFNFCSVKTNSFAYITRFVYFN